MLMSAFLAVRLFIYGPSADAADPPQTPTWARLETSWGHLGPFWCHGWAISRPLESNLGPPGAILGCAGTIVGPS